MVREPITVDVLEVTFPVRLPLVRRAVVDVLSAVGEVEFRKISVVGPGTGKLGGILLGVVAVEVHQHRMWLPVLRLQVVSPDDHRLSVQAVRYGIHFHQVHFAFVGAFPGDFREFGVHVHSGQLRLAGLPE